MQDIDFLPVEYLEGRIRRQAQPWRIVVGIAFVVLVLAATFAQYHRLQIAEADLAAIEPEYNRAVDVTRRLADVQAELKTAGTRAELYAYLRHPWPCTQLLAALLAPLPEEIAFQQVQIARETPQTQGLTALPQPEQRPEDPEKDKLPAAARDLKTLRERYDARRLTVLIAGTTTDTGALHRYLSDLGKSRMFCHTEPISIDAAQGSGGSQQQFQALLIARPGYGQPGGPKGPEPRAIAKTASKAP